MEASQVLTAGQQGLYLLMMVSAPLLLTVLVVGLVVSVFQAATQINEATLSFVPKLVVIFVVLIVTGPWMIATMTDYMRRLFEGIPGMIG